MIKNGKDYECPICSTIFYRSPSQLKNFKGENPTCSPACGGKAKLGKGTSPSTKVGTTCKNCGVIFQIHLCRYKGDGESFCSIACKSKEQKGKNAGSLNFFFTDSIKNVECEICKKLVPKNRARRESAKHHFCSHTCHGKWKSENTQGPNNPYWAGGLRYSRGPNWKIQRKIAAERDGIKCKICSAKSGLTVHHIKPFKSFGWISGENKNYIQANEISNLVTLCRKCHGKVERGGLKLPA